MKVSAKGRALIKEFEGLRLQAYKCAAGVPTIGWGSTSGVTMGMTITASDAEARLAKDLEPVESVINSTVKVSLTQNQFDALAAFIFNVGPGAFIRSTLKKCLDLGDFTSAADQFLVWNKARNAEGKAIALKGLNARRSKERDLFNSKD
jgi:lysozyme